MHDIASRTRCSPRAGRLTRWTRALPAAVLLASLCWGGPVQAHKVQVFAAVQGHRIEGQAYVAGGDPVRGRPVSILDPAGQVLGKTVTDQTGRFTFQPERICDHTVVVDAGLGHKVRCTILASELPAALTSSNSDGGSESSVVAERQATAASRAPDEGLASRIDSLDQQVFALRADIDKWKSQLRAQDVVGGVGYIVGLTGLAYFLLGYRRKREPLS